MKSHRCSLTSLRPNESTNDPPCSESSANRKSFATHIDRIGRAHLQRKIPKRGWIYA